MVIRRFGYCRARVDDGGAHAVDRLAHDGVGQADQDHLPDPGAMSTSTSTIAPETPARPTDQVRASVTERRPQMRDERRAVGPDQHADDVEPQLRGVLVVRGEPPLGEGAQLPLLGPGDRLDGVSEARAPPGLHLAEDERVAVAGDDVELALPAPPVAVEHPQTGVGEIVAATCSPWEPSLSVVGTHRHSWANGPRDRPGEDLWTAGRLWTTGCGGCPAARGRACPAPRS